MDILGLGTTPTKTEGKWGKKIKNEGTSKEHGTQVLKTQFSRGLKSCSVLLTHGTPVSQTRFSIANSSLKDSRC